MQNFKVFPYQPSHKIDWDNFVMASNQDTFLFQRDFMDYHSDHFQDASLMVFKKDKLVALLPANRQGNEVHSHQGLSYGGLINTKDLKSEDSIQIFKAILKYLHSNDIVSLSIKELPVIYLHNQSNNPLSYLYFKSKAVLKRMDMLSVIDMKYKSYSNSRKEGLKRGAKNHLFVKESGKFDLFWNHILIPNLTSKHGVSPVHSLEEITLLKSMFPKNIRQFNVFHEDKMVAGTTIFETEHVAHCQYISGNVDKNELGSLDFLHVHLLDEVFKDKLYFSFGTSNINAGQNINLGLQFWKEGFGARSMTQGFYTIKTENYKFLEDVFI